jgi:acetyl esterase/lipase
MKDMIGNIPYAVQSTAQKLDIYLPEGVQGAMPVIVWLHPGGFTMGDKNMIKPLIDPILARGYAAVSVNYQLAGEALFPAQIYDAKAAVRWVRANAGKYNFDPNKIAAWGISAGSTLAALLGTSGHVKELEDLSMGNAAESARVNAVVSWYGPTDFFTVDSQHFQLGHKPKQGTESSGESKLMGGSISKVPEKYRAASAIIHITDACPPFYIQHGKADEVIPYLQSVMFASALEAVIGKAKVTLNLIENAGHFDRIHSSTSNINASLDFLDRQLK